MKRNVGKIDRIIRIIGAVIIAVVLFKGMVALTSLIGIILVIAGVILLFTGATSWCAIYQLVGASTCPAETDQA